MVWTSLFSFQAAELIKKNPHISCICEWSCICVLVVTIKPMFLRYFYYTFLTVRTVCYLLILSVSLYQYSLYDFRQSVRATCILIPLLGIQYVALPFRPPDGNEHGQYVYDMASASLSSFQVGFNVPLRFRMKRMFSSFLTPVVCGGVHVLFALFVFVSVWWCPTHIVLCICSFFVL